MKSNLIELIKENPDLPIFAWVDSDVVPDDGYSRWIGQLGLAIVREYSNVNPYGCNERTTVFKDDSKEYHDWLVEDYMYETKADEEEAIKVAGILIEKLNYKKAIFVDVDLPNNI